MAAQYFAQYFVIPGGTPSGMNHAPEIIPRRRISWWLHLR